MGLAAGQAHCFLPTKTENTPLKAANAIKGTLY